tara:strand:- start:159 stop:770 length:612 start_codon:yes stop_codon:yes gene_type:complete
LKKNKISKNWINKQKRDIFVRKSKIEGYRSRAVYKLEEINKKFKILDSSYNILDLGGAPGSWSQYVSKEIKIGKILSIDLIDMEKIDKVFQLKGDFTLDSNQQKIRKFFMGEVDLVLSDMAVNTTGNKDLDSLMTGNLCLEAMEFSKKILKKDGKFVAKIFMGSSFKELNTKAQKIFKKVNIYKPKASRKNSKENFIICQFLC